MIGRYCWWNQAPMERRAGYMDVVEGGRAEFATNMLSLELAWSVSCVSGKVERGPSVPTLGCGEW